MRNDLAKEMFGCDAADLVLLDKCRYDLGRIVRDLKERGIVVTLQGILDEILDNGIEDMEMDFEEESPRFTIGSDKALKDRFDELVPAEDFYLSYDGFKSYISCEKLAEYKEIVPRLLEKLEDRTGLYVSA